MRILFIAPHSPYFVDTAVYREKAIVELGHQLISFEDRDFILPGRIRKKVDFLHRWDLKRLNKKLVRLASNEKPDLCIVLGGQWILPDTLSEIKKMGISVVLWTADVPRHFNNILKTAHIYDFIFCAGTEAVEILKNQGLEKVFWLPFACDPDYHHPVELTDREMEEYAKDIVFVGSFYPNRARVLESIFDLDIAVWGPYWSRLDKNSILKKKVVDARVNYKEWVKMYNASKIVLVAHYNDGKTPCNQASPKLYEALACRSFVLVDDQKDARALFEDKKHVVFFRDGKDLREKIGYYLNHPEERKKIAYGGYEEVLRKHTYRHRIGEIFRMLETGNKEARKDER
ncbi:glycosyltransferase [Patescibacteria group bacterium]|nr:glycosyltransferase [Patescibacteria group bacterium]